MVRMLVMPSKYIKKGESPEGRERRLRVFKHNSFVGHARMMMMQAQNIAISDTTTKEAKEIAYEIAVLATKLERYLKTRVNPE